MRGLVPRIHDFLYGLGEDEDGWAFAAPKRLRPRRQDKPDHDGEEVSTPTIGKRMSRVRLSGHAALGNVDECF